MSHESPQASRFDDFMQCALHDPDTGYYARSIQTVGASGDFSTTATLSTVLGKAIAQSALDWQRSNHTPLNMIEIGGGDGSLADSIIKSLPILKRWKLNYHLVDSSSTLTQKQQQRRNLRRKITWHQEITSALKSCKGVAFIFSNELVDAFPVRIFEKSNSPQGWKELYLLENHECLKEVEDELPQSSSLKYKKHMNKQRVEVHESYKSWLSSWLPDWQRGQLLTIDYGDIHPQLYYRMPKGTIRAYARHQRLTGSAIYQNPGKQDITADVNFTDLMDWGQLESLKTISLTTQAKYLSPYVTTSPEDNFLIHPDGAGSAFKVLLQEKT